MQAAKGLWRRFLGFLEGGADDDEWEDSEHEFVDYDAYSHDPAYDEGLDLAGMEKRNRTKKPSNVLDFDTGREPVDMVTVRIVRPREIQDATLVCEYLHDNMICIVDMQGADHSTAQRIADYLGGVSYALKGQVERIDSYIFVMAPEGAKIDSDLREELKGGGLFKSFR